MPRKGWVAAVLSAAIPGLGQIYAGTFWLAALWLAIDRLAPPGLDVLAGAGVVSVAQLSASKLVLPVVVRLGAAVHAVVLLARREPQAPLGAYVGFAAAWFVSAVMLARVSAIWVGEVVLSDGSRVMVSRWRRPQAGEQVVFAADGGLQVGPLTPEIEPIGVPLQ